MPNSNENWELRAISYSEQMIEPLVLPPKDKNISYKECIEIIVKSLNNNEELDVMVELLKRPFLIDLADDSLPTTYQFKSTVLADSILPPINPNHR